MSAVDPGLVDRLVAALEAGEPVVIPTDTVYGLAALPSVPGATNRLYALKDRRPDVPLAVLVAGPESLDEVAAAADPRATDLVSRHWPGPLTLVVRRRPTLAVWDLGGDPGTIGVRSPDHPLVRAVAERVGPIATTSANRHGRPTPATAAEAAASLTGPVAVVADGGPLDGLASTVVDLTVEPWRILRQGALDIG
ncbi:MAG TPA: L-threonylcarbamoyladenylate synthase [Iamia sp.]|nr:L-threonylcarbamoyladenylate synthase [Iamia sp.]